MKNYSHHINQNNHIILGIESSCDDTSVSGKTKWMQLPSNQITNNFKSETR